MKKNFVMLLVAFLSVAGLAACSDDERDDATSMAVSGWYGSYVVTIALIFTFGYGQPVPRYYDNKKRYAIL